MFSSKITALLLASFTFAFSSVTVAALSSNAAPSAPKHFDTTFVESLPLDLEAMIPEAPREHGTFNVSRVQTAAETVIVVTAPSTTKEWKCSAPRGLDSDVSATVKVCSFVDSTSPRTVAQILASK